MDNNISMPVKEFMPEILMYESAGMYISLPRSYFDFPSRGSHKHEGYEFMLPLTDMPLIEIDGKIIYGLKNHIVPINPQQVHGVSGRMENVRFINVFFSEELLNNVICDVFHEKNILFANKNHPISMELYSQVSIFMRECARGLPGKQRILQNLSSNIALLIYREIMMGSNLLQLGQPFNSDSLKIKKVVEYIHGNYKRECSLKELSEVAGISRYHLIRIFSDHMGKTPYDYLLETKIENAKSLLAKDNLTITDICHECGFNNMSHFIRLFKKRIGVTPSHYRSLTKLQQ